MAMGKPEHPSRVRSTRQGATINNYIHAPHRHRSTNIDDEVARLVEINMQKGGASRRGLEEARKRLESFFYIAIKRKATGDTREDAE